MKRLLLTTTMSAMLAVAAPGVASAHQGERHHRAHHANAHRHHHHHHHAAPARVRIFGTPAAPVSSTPPSTPPVTSPSRNDEPAGTVASFANGVLTITLKDGSTVSGKVTDRTEIHCRSMTAPPTNEDGDHHGGRPGEDGNSSGRDGGDDGSRDDNGGGDDANEHSCTTAALVAGAVVREAKLIVSVSGAVWANVDLIG